MKKLILLLRTHEALCKYLLVFSTVMTSLNEFSSHSRPSERKRFVHDEVKPPGAILSSQIQGLSNEL